MNEEEKKLWNCIEETEDVAEKRFLMSKLFYSLIGDDIEEFREMKTEQGYLFKLSQDFLLDSSTFQKKQKLEKIIEHI